MGEQVSTDTVENDAVGLSQIVKNKRVFLTDICVFSYYYIFIIFFF